MSPNNRTSMMSRLRKRPEPSSSPPAAFRPALSLPDLTTPLLEINMDAMPSSSTFPTSLSAYASPAPARPTFDTPPTTASTPDHGAGAGAPLSRAGVAFGLAQTRDEPSTPKRTRAPSLVRTRDGQSPQYHRPFTPWQVVPALNGGAGKADAIGAGDSAAHGRWASGEAARGTSSARRRRGKVYGRLNVVVSGQSGVGKTSFIHTLLRSLDVDSALPAGRTTRPALHSHVLESARLVLRLVDTPGLVRLAPAAEFERERGVKGLLRVLEERLGDVMREESKVVRRKDEGDELVHLVIYMLDAREIIKPHEEVGEVEWTLPIEEEVPANGHDHKNAAVPPSEVEVLRRLAARANVVAVLGHVDALSSAELDAARQAVRRDLASIGVFGDEAEDVDEEEDASTSGRPLTPASLMSSTPTYAFFAPDAGSMTRKFAWGEADVLNPAHSDLAVLRETMLGEKAETTREVLYERFRTERLLAKHARESSA